ncbi:VanZ family protein [Lutibacter sp.]|uniref:VanZ family protein n=1 Tax=Lutibacter sp. TaxID=1925666 RepID=UPI003563A0C8
MNRNFLFLALILTVGVGIGSLISLNNTPITTVHVSDKLMHLAAYFLISISWLLTFKNNGNIFKINRLIFVLILLYGILIEVLQGVFTSYRQFDLLDILANFIGILTGFVVFFIISKKK